VRQRSCRLSSTHSRYRSCFKEGRRTNAPFATSERKEVLTTPHSIDDYLRALPAYINSKPHLRTSLSFLHHPHLDLVSYLIPYNRVQHSKPRPTLKKTHNLQSTTRLRNEGSQLHRGNLPAYCRPRRASAPSSYRHTRSLLNSWSRTVLHRQVPRSTVRRVRNQTEPLLEGHRGL
jgi:hypothetical protein